MKKITHRIFAAGAILVGTVVLAIQLQAGSYESIREARDRAWQKCEWNPVRGLTTSMPKEQQINGAVNEKGKVTAVISDWKNQAIPKSDGEVSVYFREIGSNTIGVLFKDSLVTVLEKGKERTYIQSGKMVGYVDTYELYFEEEARQRAEKVCDRKLQTDVSKIKIKGRADLKSSDLAILEQRVLYPIISHENGWYGIEISEEFANSGYVQDEEEVKEVYVISVAQNNKNNNYLDLYQLREASAKEKKLLATIVFCEANAEPFDGKVAVAEVILNRRDSDKYPDTIKEVIYQKGQFEPVSMGWYDKVINTKQEIPKSCYEAADAALQGQSIFPEALFFDKGGKGEKLGTHWFRSDWE